MQVSLIRIQNVMGVEFLEEANAAGPINLREKEGELRTRYDEQLAADAKQIDEEIATLRTQLAALEQKRSVLANASEDALDKELTELTRAEDLRKLEADLELKGLRDRLKAKAASENTRQVVEGFKEEVEELTGQSEKLTSIIGRLDELQHSLAEKLPLKFEIRGNGKELYQDGIRFARVNTAGQYKAGIRLAINQAGEVAFVCVDGIERLDGDTFEAFKEAAAGTGAQFIITRVTPLTGEDAPEGLQITTDRELVTC